jgi:AAA+ ATPase superfamily predicted ATPase
MFKSGMPVSGEDFIDRKQHLIKFNTFIQNNQHIMIKAPRRYGKTSLVVHLFEIHKYPKIYVDIKRATSLHALAEQIINEAYKYAGVEGIISKAKASITGLFKHLKGTLKIDIEIAELTIETLEKSEKKQIDEVAFFLYAIELVETIAKKQNIALKFAFDEFQDILTIADKKILDALRSVIQHHQHVTYIFLGSIESIMNTIFSSKTSPFFHFARVIELDGLDIDELKTFCKDFFKAQQMTYDTFLFDVLAYLEGHPYYTMKTLQSIYYKMLEERRDNIQKEDCIEALTIALFETKSYLEEIIGKIKQKKYHYSVLWHLANGLKDKTVESATLYKAYKSLEDMGYVKKRNRGEYTITDIFLKILLQQKNDSKLLEEKVEFIGLER